MLKPIVCLLFLILPNLAGGSILGCAAHSVNPANPAIGEPDPSASSLRIVHALSTTRFVKPVPVELEPIKPVEQLIQNTQGLSSQMLAARSKSMPPADNTALLAQSWAAYRQRFIQSDGRVIDWEQNARTVSEGQAYAMLRSVFANDPATFDLTLKWAENNLLRSNEDGQPLDSLWAWKWGQDEQGQWGVLDPNFASDADLDAITALILASRRWDRPEYLALARTKLADLWNLSTVTSVTSVMPVTSVAPVAPVAPVSPGTSARPVSPPAVAQSRTRSSPQRYFLPGPVAAFQPNPPVAYLNPSYLAPYAFRLFAQVDPQRNWLSLVDSSYEVLQQSTQLSAVKLPSDWVAVNLATGQFQAPSLTTQLRSTYSFDAYRVWWRIALDAVWFNEPRAEAFLESHLGHLQTLWQTRQAIPARINLRGAATARYEATSQYAMLYPAFRVVNPALAEEIRQQKLLPTYQDGIWDNDSAYYVQNLAWLGLFPPSEMQEWIQAE